MTARLFTVRDFTILKKLQSKLRSEVGDLYNLPRLKGLKYCMARSDSGLGVDVGKTSNGKLALRGVTYCHNTWACPSCTPRAMMKIATRLKAAYKMLGERGYEARMITFTVPHQVIYAKNVTFGANLNIMLHFLRTTFNSFLSGTIKHVRPKDCYTFQIFEVTHGKNGWHPHIHAIYWFKKEEWSAFLEKEQNLVESWHRHCCKIGKKMMTDEMINQADYEEILGTLPTSNNPGVYISKHTNEVYNYINDGLANEVTTLHFKEARRGNLTIWQILDLALKDNNEQCWKLFIEYALATQGLHRWRFNRGFVTEIDCYMKEHPQIDIAKKKQAEDAVAVTQVAWFTSLQWNLLNMRCENFLQLLAFIVTRIDDVDTAYKLLCRLCKKYDLPIPLRENPLRANDASAWAA